VKRKTTFPCNSGTQGSIMATEESKKDLKLPEKEEININPYKTT